MATKPKPAAAPSTSRAVATWDEELAAAAAASAKMEEGSAGGQFFSIKGGILTWNDAPIKDNTLAAIILDSVLENVYYTDAFDSDNPAPPTCFAFGRAEADMAPHKTVVEAGQAQNPQCGQPGKEGCCEHNEWGTADKGRGKACRNVRRVALLAAGTFDAQGRFVQFPELESFEQSSFGFLKVPVTSVKGYASYVKTIADTLKRPPWAVITKIKVFPDAKKQVGVSFEPLANASVELLPILKRRNAEAAALIESPYPLSFGEDEQPVRGPVSRKGAKAAPAKKTSRRY
jgi:hypothetical protein